MATTLHLQLKRFSGPFSTHDSAIKAINDHINDLKQGEPIIAGYHTIDNDKASKVAYILGIRTQPDTETPQVYLFDHYQLSEDLKEQLQPDTVKISGYTGPYELQSNEKEVVVNSDDTILKAISKLVKLANDNKAAINNVSAATDTKQSKLTAGSGITIDENNTIAVQDIYVLKGDYTKDKDALSSATKVVDDKVNELSGKAVTSITSAVTTDTETPIRVTEMTTTEGGKAYGLSINGDDIKFTNPKFGLSYENGKIAIVTGDSSTNVVDATDFIKDGMISSVKISEDKKSIVITWNTDSGHKPVTLDLSGLTEFYDFKNEITSTEGNTTGTTSTNAIQFNVDDSNGLPRKVSASLPEVIDCGVFDNTTTVTNG